MTLDVRLLQVSNMFIVSLATADLTVGLVVMPISAIYIFSVDWPFGLVVCQFWLIVDYTASTASILNLLVLSIDRYRSVTDPLQYLRRRTSRYASLLIIAAWSLSALWVLPIVAWHWMFADGRRSVLPGRTIYTVKLCNFLSEFPPILIIFGRKMAKRLKLCKVHALIFRVT